MTDGEVESLTLGSVIVHISSRKKRVVRGVSAPTPKTFIPDRKVNKITVLKSRKSWCGSPFTFIDRRTLLNRYELLEERYSFRSDIDKLLIESKYDKSSKIIKFEDVPEGYY